MTFVSNAIDRKGVFARWRRREEGQVAVEFALVGLPFILMTIGIVEMALMFTAQSVLHESTFTASRLIRTGQLQKSAASGQETMFKDAVCDFASLLIPCGQIRYQVQKLDSFADADDAPAYDSNGNLITTPFDAGAENDVVMIRVAYNYPIRTPLMSSMLTSRTDGTRQLVSTVVLQTEPYQ